MKQALFIGATGMLARAAAHILARQELGFLVSRGAEKFSFGDASLDRKIRPLPFSYEDESAVLARLNAHAPFDVVLSWIRPTAEPLRNAIANHVAPGGLLLEVLGSRSGRPGGFADSRAEAMENIPSIIYAQLVLGMVREGDETRWHSHEEISSGAICLFENPVARHVLGEIP